MNFADSNTLVSVIIPVFNGEKYLREAIESVLAQTYTDTEIVLIDDGSTDGTAELVKQSYPDIRYHYQENAGLGAARNRGIDEARGDYIAFLDADDLWLKDKLRMQMQVLQEQPDVEMVFGHVKQFHSPELDEESRRQIRCPKELMPGQLPTTMLCRRRVFPRVGPFETHWEVGVDVNWIMRTMEEEISHVMLPDLIYMRRLHKTNEGIVKRDAIGDRVKMMKEFLDRKRAREAASNETEK